MASTFQSIGQPDDDLIAFGPFRLDPLRRQLTRDGTPVPLGDRAFGVLQLLIRHAPAVVSKATLFEQVWPGTFVAEETLRYQLWSLRKALGDGEDGDGYISTASGRGYCFTAALTSVRAVTGPAQTKIAEKPAMTNLPLQLTEIIGRERELKELESSLTESRLVTLAGPGGVGKTRLAVELGRHVLGDFAGGVWLIDLAPLSHRDTVASAVATALGVSGTQTEASADSIINALGKTRLLLIFDNCEHLVEAAALLIKTLLERAPGVSILATSQKSFQLAAEWVYALDPLAVPPDDATEIEGFAAVELFCRRAQAADRLFVVDRGNSAAVAEICRDLDGLPLALEMAAGRLRLLGIEGLRRGLGDRLKLLKRMADGEARHSSLHGMLDWSHSLLDPSDQAIFHRLAAFPAGFSLDAAVAVAGGDEMARWQVVDALGRLIDQSLVTLERREPMRYRLLETLRLYATDKLQHAGETDVMAARHARHFTEVFDESDRCWEEMPTPDWIGQYRPELDNLRTALDWALAVPERHQAAIALVASGSLLLYSLVLLGEGRRYQERVIPLVDAETPVATVARLLKWASTLWCGSAQDMKGLAYAERSAALYRELDDGPGLATALMPIAQYMMMEGQSTEAKALHLKARHLLADSTYRKSQLKLAVVTALGSYRANDIPEGQRLSLEALESARKLNPMLESTLLTNLGVGEYVLGNIDRAIEFTEAALERSKAMFGDAQLGQILKNLSSYLIAKGEIGEARSRLEEAFSILVERGNYPAEFCLRSWAQLASVEGRLAEAARLVGFTDADRARRRRTLDHASLPLYNRVLGILQAGLSPAELDALKAEGAQWSEAEAIRFVADRLLPPPA